MDVNKSTKHLTNPTYLHLQTPKPRQHAFAAQLGISSLLCYALACGDRTPHKFVFHKRSARLLSVELRPGHGNKVRGCGRSWVGWV